MNEKIENVVDQQEPLAKEFEIDRRMRAKYTASEPSEVSQVLNYILSDPEVGMSPRELKRMEWYFTSTKGNTDSFTALFFEKSKNTWHFIQKGGTHEVVQLNILLSKVSDVEWGIEYVGVMQSVFSNVRGKKSADIHDVLYQVEFSGNLRISLKNTIVSVKGKRVFKEEEIKRVQKNRGIYDPIRNTTHWNSRNLGGR